MILKTINTFPPIAAILVVGIVFMVVGVLATIFAGIVVGVVVMVVFIVCIFFNLNTKNNGHMLHLIKYLRRE